MILNNRSVTGQSTVLSISPDGSKFMAGSTLYDTATLAVIGQMNTANLPFFITTTGFNPAFNVQANFGGSVSRPTEAQFTALSTHRTQDSGRQRVCSTWGVRRISVSGWGSSFRRAFSARS